MVLMIDIPNQIAMGAQDQVFMVIGGNTTRLDTFGRMRTIHQLVFATRKQRIRIHVHHSQEKATYATISGRAQETVLVIASFAENCLEKLAALTSA
jgi:hypothetical protein